MSTPTLAELQLTRDVTIRDVQVVDVRFPTSLFRIGSDAVNTDPDYSAAYITLVTDTEEQGYGLTFTLGRGTEVCVLAIQFLAGFVRGRKLSAIVSDFGVFVRELVRDTQFRWLGPEKGVVHLAAAALINAVWDLYARVAGKPVWQLLAEMPSEHLVRLMDFSYITDALTPAEAYEILQAGQVGLAERLAELKRTGVPAYTTSPGWIGLRDDEVRTLCTQAAAQGFRHVKMKVGGAHEEDMRRAALIRSTLPPYMRLMMDANQRWDVGEAIERTRALSVFDPWWMEEPTSPDDILGHAAIRRETGVRIATGEHCQNRVIFKQLLQAGATDVVQIDSCRLAGVNENVTVLLLAAKFGVPVCAHAGGVGLCEYVQHLAAFDYLRVACTFENRVTEFVDHLHEHFTDPVEMVNGHYRLPIAPGYSAQMWDASVAEFQFPHGRAWADHESV
ncbi:enolase C-terminal domain-like protein [Terriglobus aquaticus]|uniref:Enolase C-terminal domain-like protein n=1 Tax=Terriglobus aquaticus TaxID=940139 RepID=A0ABW9KKB4_9BACT|nr:enolase C-terminal domain-like protein [Terriglobus aquaticus]